MESRMKITDAGCYYHLFNRISCVKGEKPFHNTDKEYGFRLLQNLCEYFLIEVISAAWMGNHFHLVVYAPSPEELPPIEEIVKRHNDYYKSMRPVFTYGPKMPTIAVWNTAKCHEIGNKMIDISRFMSAYQQRFTKVYNKDRNRTGQLWSGRFKSVILERAKALENCVKYVELNPVRAHIVNDPSDYRFTTWGRYCGSGKHMFHDNFVKHMKPFDPFGPDASQWTDEEVFTYYRGELARIVAYESDLSEEEIIEAKKLAHKKESMPIRFLRRTRHFTDGAILGSKLFLRETASKFDNPNRVNKKQFSRGFSPSGIAIYCYRKLQC